MKKLGNEIKEKILPFFTLCFRKVKLFAEKRFLFFTLATNIAFFISMVALYLKWHTIPWTLAIGFPMTSAAVCFIWYIQEFLSWCHTHGHQGIKRFIFIACDVIILLSPVIAFLISTNLAKLYFIEASSTLEMICYCSLLAFYLLFVYYYCTELKDIIHPRFSPAFRAKYLVTCVIHIAQLFANIYIILFIMYPYSFSGIDTSSAFAISFDFTYFSTMTLLTAGSEIVAVSRLARVIVLIEVFIFVIVISMIIFGIFSSNTETGYDNNDSISKKEDSCNENEFELKKKK